jgi:hypothetical protein
MQNLLLVEVEVDNMHLVLAVEVAVAIMDHHPVVLAGDLRLKTHRRMR